MIKIIKQLYVIAAAVVMTAVAVSCSKDNDPITEDNDPVVPVDTVPAVACTRPERLVQLTGCTRWTVSEFSELLQDLYRLGLGTIYGDSSATVEAALDVISIAHFGDNVPILAAKFLKEGSIGFHFERQNFLYRSVTAAGDSATFSGSVVYPFSNSGMTHTLDGWTIYTDYGSTNNENRMSNFVEVPYFRAAFNQAVAFSDIQGFGATNMKNVDATTPLLPCFFDNYAKGRQTVDAAVAASQVLEMKGLEMAQDQFVENMGFSLGAPGAFGVVKYIESEKDCPAWVRDSLMRGIRTFAAAGPLDTWEVFTDLVEKDEPLAIYHFPIALVVSAFASFPDQFNDYTLNDFFDPRMSDIMVPTILGDTMCIIDAIACNDYEEWAIQGANELETLFEGRITKMLHPGMFDADGKPNLADPRMALFKMALESYSVSDGWNPKSPVLIAHSKDDELTDIDRITDVYNQFKSTNNDVGFLPLAGDHTASAFLSHIYTLLNPHPSLYVDKWAPILEMFKQKYIK